METKQTFRERILELETVRFALDHGYVGDRSNETAIRHFSFRYSGTGSPDIDVSWFAGSDGPCVTVGNMSTDDRHALQILKKYW